MTNLLSFKKKIFALDRGVPDLFCTIPDIFKADSALTSGI
jgi:hypothetical protein